MAKSLGFGDVHVVRATGVVTPFNDTDPHDIGDDVINDGDPHNQLVDWDGSNGDGRDW